MKTRKALTVLAACIGFVAYFDKPAHSADGLYAQIGAWTVRGNSETGTCYTSAPYPDGVTLTIFFTQDGTTSLMLDGVSVHKGQFLAVDVATSDGNSGTINGFGYDDGAALFEGLNRATVRALANAEKLFVQGLGIYNLVKSRAALLKTYECVKALSGGAV